MERVLSTFEWPARSINCVNLQILQRVVPIDLLYAALTDL